MEAIDREEARRSILRRQGLVPRCATSVEGVRAALAVQSQYAFTVPLAVSSRSASYTAGWTERQLENGRKLVKTWSVRYTLHTLLEEDHTLVQQATGAVRFARFANFMHRDRVADGQLARLLDGVREALRDGPLTRREIHARVPELQAMPGTGWGLDVMGLAYLGELGLAGSGEGVTRFRLLDPPPPRDPVEACAELLLRYLESYAPATLADFAYWCGISRALAKSAFEAARGRFELVKLEERTAMVPLGFAPVGASVPRILLLPKFDALLMGFADKSLFLPDRLRPKVIRKAGQIEAIVLKRGVVCATWRMRRGPKVVAFEVEPYSRLTPLDVAALERQAERLAKRTYGLEAVVQIGAIQD